MHDHHVRHVFAIWQLATLYLKQKLLWKATRLTCARGMDTIALLHVKIMQANYSSANFVTLPLIPLIILSLAAQSNNLQFVRLAMLIYLTLRHNLPDRDKSLQWTRGPFPQCPQFEDFNYQHYKYFIAFPVPLWCSQC